MSNEPRRPLDRQPDEPGWWVGSDGRWYPPELAPTERVPVTPPRDPTAVLPVIPSSSSTPNRPKKTSSGRIRGLPLWAKIGAPILIVVVIAVIVGLGASSTRPPVAVPSTSTTGVSVTTHVVGPTPTQTPPAIAPPTTSAPSTVPASTGPHVTKPSAPSPSASQPPRTSTPATVLSVQPGVHPGASCSPLGARGTTVDGTAMICSDHSASGTPNDRPRWRSG